MASDKAVCHSMPLLCSTFGYASNFAVIAVPQVVGPSLSVIGNPLV
jgi:hypothetical protein